VTEDAVGRISYDDAEAATFQAARHLAAAADTDSKTSPVVDALDLLVLRKVE
jgi:hypothetical protein